MSNETARGPFADEMRDAESEAVERTRRREQGEKLQLILEDGRDFLDMTVGEVKAWQDLCEARSNLGRALLKPRRNEKEIKRLEKKVKQCADEDFTARHRASFQRQQAQLEALLRK